MSGRRRALVALGLAALLTLAGWGAEAAGRPRATSWCGSDRAAADRLPDAVAGPQIHVIYATPSDGDDRFQADASLIVSDLGALDAWWRREDATRTLRFDLSAFPGCSGGLEALDLSSVRLPHDEEYYSPIGERPGRLGAELASAFAHPAKKYLVYYDGEVSVPFDCGQSTVAPETGGAEAYSFVYLRAEGCTHDLGAGGGSVGYAAHELVHNLGAVPDAAPHVCYEHSVCDWYWDVAMQFPTGDPIVKLILDYGRDDYYGHSGAWFDVQDSAWLTHAGAPMHELTVTKGGRGRGSVASDLPGISCPDVCTIGWEQGTEVVLRATAADGSRFLRWGGACTGGAACTVTMDAPKQVSATFAPAFVSLAVAVQGRGSVSSNPPGITCPGRCTSLFPSGATVRLRARARLGWRFVRWSRTCRGRGGCFVYTVDDRWVGAVFRRR